MWNEFSSNTKLTNLYSKSLPEKRNVNGFQVLYAVHIEGHFELFVLNNISLSYVIIVTTECSMNRCIRKDCIYCKKKWMFLGKQDKMRYRTDFHRKQLNLKTVTKTCLFDLRKRN